MNLIVFFQSVFIGILLCIPIGPVALLIVKKTIFKGRYTGTIAALGSVSADIFYSTAVVLGINFIANFVNAHLILIKAIAAIIIAIMGLKTFFTKIPHKLESEQTTNQQNYLQTFILTVSNMLTFGAIAGFLAAFGIETNHYSFGKAATIVGGIAIGELIWWHILIFGANYAGKHASQRILRHLNHAAGITLMVLSLLILLSFMYTGS